MKAAVYRKGEIVIAEASDPVPEKGQVLVRSLACGICGSDLHFRHHAHTFVEIAMRAGAGAFAMDLERDIVMGHEFAAELMDFGPGAQRRLKPGTLVCCVPTGRVNGQSRTIGQSNELPGGFGEYMALTEDLLLEIPNGLPVTHAALTEPMAVGLHAARLAALGPEHVPLVLGCGPVGLAVIAALKLQNVSPIIAADFSPGRRALAQRMGADIVLDPREQSAYERLAQEARPAGAKPRPSAIFECVGAPGMIRQAMEGAPAGAQIIVVGACMEPDSIEPMFGIYKALSLKFALAYSAAEFAETLRLIAEGQLDVAPLVTGVIGLDEVPGAFEALAQPDHHAKIVVEPWR
jgi:threonine dehydrogenase-like Zn-dependent dehydrogenase